MTSTRRELLEAALASGSAAWAAPFLEGLEPPRAMSVTEWAERYARLPAEGSAEVGRLNLDRTPYTREPLDALGPDHPCEAVSMMFGRQLAKTTTGIVWLGYCAHHDPGPFLAVQPTVDMAKRYSGQRIGPTIAATPVLRETFQTGRSRDSGNTVLLKRFPGGVLILTGANSAAGLMSMPARYLHADEVDTFETIPGQGEPFDLALATTRTFRGRRKVLATSTPTIRGRSLIERRFEESDRSRFWVPCVECGGFQVLRFAGLVFDSSDPESTARYACELCGALWEEHAKDRFLTAGEWRAEAPERTPVHRGFHLSSLYSPLGWRSWGEIAAQAVRAKGNREAARAFANMDLAESYEEPGDSPDWELAYARRENYPIGSVPEGGLLLTCGVDVQADRLEAEVVAWGRGLESWSVEYVVLPGSISTAETRALLSDLLRRQYPVAGRKRGTTAAIRLLAIDAGFDTQHVYGWVRSAPTGRAIAVKGKDGGAVLLGSPTQVYHTRGSKRRGLKLHTVYGEVAKGELYSNLRLPPPADGEPFPAGWCHFPAYGQGYFRQLTSERIVPRYRRGVPVYVWEASGPNEALDCRVYARAAAYLLGVDRFTERHWTDLEARLGAAPGAAEGAPKARRRKPRPESPFGRWADGR